MAGLHNMLCIVIPVYNHVQALRETLQSIQAYGFTIILVDDGSEVSAATIIADLAKEFDCVLVVHDVNCGKGRAVKSALFKAQALGFSHALQIDADGQHNIADIPRFVECMQADDTAMVAGYPQFDASVPKLRYYGRYATHIWIWINTLSTSIRDSMCGFRIYPVATTCVLIESTHIGDRMDFDSEIIVRWFWSGAALRQLPTSVIYPEEGRSSFRLWQDNVLITRMHTRLFFGMLRRLPYLIKQRVLNG